MTYREGRANKYQSESKRKDMLFVEFSVEVRSYPKTRIWGTSGQVSHPRRVAAVHKVDDLNFIPCWVQFNALSSLFYNLNTILSLRKSIKSPAVKQISFLFVKRDSFILAFIKSPGQVLVLKKDTGVRAWKTNLQSSKIQSVLQPVFPILLWVGVEQHIIHLTIDVDNVNYVKWCPSIGNWIYKSTHETKWLFVLFFKKRPASNSDFMFQTMQ